MPWRTRATDYRKREDAIYKKLVDEAVSGKTFGMNTWAAAFARPDKPEGDQRRLLNQFTGAAIETTALSLHTFVLACIRYPEWISTAQKEIDVVVGSDRLPTFQDRPLLPYVEAIVRGLMFSWLSGSDIGLICLFRDPLLAPRRAIEHQQSRFEDHDRFMPGRFLDAGGQLKPDYETSAFGFGRRMCPGIPFTERSLWIATATMLWTFNILPDNNPDPKTGLPFQYDDSDVAFDGSVRICCF
ncbi:hypothetical protein C0993_009245 [Termitomyces sp. T159_Od127]|nr:hypothetical protein C0993_009245 [Termitomyces sp. T159_Od127]